MSKLIPTICYICEFASLKNDKFIGCYFENCFYDNKCKSRNQHDKLQTVLDDLIDKKEL